MEAINLEKVLDATKIEPKYKHSTIIDRFLSLEKDDYFVLQNDHDPVPLYYQFQAEYPNTFKWEYLKKGPETWEVLITKTVGEKNNDEPTIGEIVAEDYRTADVFSKYGLDFCCNGQKTIEEACEKVGVNATEVKKELENMSSDSSAKMNKFNQWSLDFLADYIVNNHHSYVKENAGMLTELSQKIATVHGGHHPELIEIAPKFKEAVDLLQAHMVKEESTLFPYIKKLVEAKKTGQKIDKPPFGTIQNPINQMEKEHEETGEGMEEIRKLSQNYLVPQDGCNTYRVTFAKMEEFEKDLHQHVHLENNILFQKALKLEKEVLK